MPATQPKKYKYDQNDPAFLRFRRKMKSPATRKAWVSALNMYMEFRGTKTYSALLKGTPEQQEQWLEEYIEWKQETKGVRSQSVSSQLSGLRKFYRANKYKGIDWEDVREALGEAIKAVKDKPYTHEQIAKLVAACPPKARIIVYSEASGGPRIGSFPNMKVGDLTKNEQSGLYRTIIYPHTEAEYVTFFGPEATKEIDEYLAHRARSGETITADSPLIRDDFTKKTVGNPCFIAKSTMEGIISRAAVNAGLRTINKGKHHERKETMLTHGLRKFFKQQCRRAGLDHIVIEWLVGHKSGEAKIGINKLMMTYDPAMEDELLSEYLKAVDNLTINEENRIKRKLESKEKELEFTNKLLTDTTEILKLVPKDVLQNLGR